MKHLREARRTSSAETGFEGTFAEFSEFLQTDPQFYYQEKDALLVA